MTFAFCPHGFTASLMYGFGGSETLRNERAAAPQTGDDFYGGNLQYNAQNWGVGLGYNRNNVVPFNTGTNPQKRTGLEMLNAGGYVGFGPVGGEASSGVSAAMIAARVCSAFSDGTSSG